MNAEIKQKWLEALRSGRYQQGRHALRDDGRYCCLGVLCDIIDPSGWTFKVAVEGMLFAHGDDMHTGIPTFSVLADAGLTERQAKQLASMNDEGGADFEAIARYIEEKLK